MASITSAMQSLFDRAGSFIPGVGSDYYSKLAGIESTYNPNAQAKASSAGGLFQFLDGTWNSYGTGSKFGLGGNVADAIGSFTKDNYNALTKALGRTPSYGELYLAHQQGAGGAISLLSNPNASATDIVGYDAVVNNGGTAGMSAGAFASLWTDKFKGMGSGGSQQGLFGMVGDLLSPMTYINAASGTTPDDAGPVAKAAADSAAKTQAGWIEWLSSGAVRVVVVVLGFIFVAVGLAMFKPGIVLNALPAGRAANAVGAVAKAAK